jgi:glycosyltransferase involved in cell wall biosynthesis
MKPDHSFVALAYRDSPFLADCLRSLRRQALPSRIVVATSTPSDYIAGAARNAGAELAVNAERRGIASDWNFGLQTAGTRFVTLAHQDDLYHPEFLARTMTAFERHPAGALCFTGWREVSDAGVPRRSKLTLAKDLIRAVTIGSRQVVSGRRLGLYLSFGNPLPCSSVTFDLSRLPGFAFEEGLASNLDWEAWWRLYRAGKVFLHCREPLVGRRYNDLTETARLIRDGRRRQEDLEMFEAIWPRLIGRTIAYLYQAGY